jgi:hypothetical protein
MFSTEGNVALADIEAEPGIPAGVDPDTGVITDAGSDLDALAQAVLNLKVQEQTIRDTRLRLEAEIIHRMQEQGASLYDGLVGTIVLSNKYTYKYNSFLLQELAEHLKPEEFNKAITYEPKVDKRVLNRLEKFGGRVAEIIRQATTVTAMTVLEIKPRRD